MGKAPAVDIVFSPSRVCAFRAFPCLSVLICLPLGFTLPKDALFACPRFSDNSRQRIAQPEVYNVGGIIVQWRLQLSWAPICSLILDWQGSKPPASLLAAPFPLTPPVSV